MPTFTKSIASTDSNPVTLAFTRYKEADWEKGEKVGACQGVFGQTINTDNSRVGLIVFPNAGSTLSKKVITEINLSFQFSGAGVNGTKSLFLYESNVQQYDSSKKGSELFGNLLTTVSGTFYNATASFKFNSTTLPEDFIKLRKYFMSGKSALVAFQNNPVKGASSSYSTHYLRILGASLTVQYEEGLVYYGKDGKWIPCSIHYGKDGAWHQSLPHYGKDSKWEIV